MKKLLVLFSLLVFTISLTACKLPSGAEYPNKYAVSPSSAKSPAKRIETKSLKLTIKTEQSQYVVGEPVYVIGKLTNIGKQALRLHSEVSPGDGATQVFVTSGDGKTAVFRPIANYDVDSSVFQNFEPGAETADVFPVFFGAQGWTFTQPGKYILQAVYESPAKSGQILSVASNSIDINIVKTMDGSGEMLVNQKDPASFEAGKFLLWQAGDHLVKGIELLDRVVNTYPDSRLAQYIHYAKAKNLSQPFANYLTKKVRAPQCDKTLQYIKQLKGIEFVSNIHVQIQFSKLRCELRSKKIKDAHSSLDKIKSIMGERPEYRALGDRMQEMEMSINKS